MKILFASLGCDKNLVDTEMMLGMISDAGYEITNDDNEADIVVVNTCAFILDAKQESIDTLLEYANMKNEGKIQCLIATGCLAQRYANELKNEIPEIDGILGTASFDKICEAITQCLSKNEYIEVGSLDKPCICGKRRVLTTGGYYAYLKIADGCDKRCTYCAIPSFRGGYRSIPIKVLVDEAKELASQGVKELIIVAQEITVYGLDLYGTKSLSRLLKLLAKVEGIEWIRLLYCYPEEIDDELIETIATEDKIVHYIDMPLQHANDKILQKMGRRTNKAFIEQLIKKLRTRIPDICLRTTFIVGFPGETQEMYEELYNFIDETEFDRLGVFTYSPEEGTIAETMANQVDEEVKKQRMDEIMLLQQEIAFDKAASLVGKILQVMIEGRLVEDGVLVGRTYMDAPNVDGYVFIKTLRDIESGTILNVKITESNEYDVIGELEDESSK